MCRSASASISSRQAQKSPPSVRPRSVRWNACECALTKPGSSSARPSARNRHRFARSAGPCAAAGPMVSETSHGPSGRWQGDAPATILDAWPPAPSRPARAAPERAHGRAAAPDPGLRRAARAAPRTARAGAAAIVFAVAGVTDQVDGFLARRWHVESAFGKIADPLADRLMIDAAVLLLCWHDRLPWVALADPGPRRRADRRLQAARDRPRLRLRGEPRSARPRPGSCTRRSRS